MRTKRTKVVTRVIARPYLENRDEFFYFIGKCCSVVAVRQEFRKKFLPKCVRWHALFLM